MWNGIWLQSEGINFKLILRLFKIPFIIFVHNTRFNYMQIKHFFLYVLFSASMYTGYAQATKINNDPAALFKQAKEYFQNNEYSLAYPVFKNLQNPQYGATLNDATIREEIKFYTIACELYLKNSAAASQAAEFISLETTTPLVQMMSFYLAEYLFEQKNYTDALTYYQKAGIDNLSNSQISTLKFHMAYAYFTLQKFNDAKPLFDVVRQIKTDPNYIDANYYYGFICFYEKNYAAALQAFTIIEKDKTYKNIVPFYIAEIYYFQGNYDKALLYAEAALLAGNQYYELPLKQLIGHLYFDKKDYARAKSYLEAYINATPTPNREDVYELAYCYYATGNYQQSITGFKELGGKQDSLAQNSMYLLADAYLKTGQKANARNAFLFCATNNANPTQKQVSIFNYAKLSYELGYFDIAQRELENFINNYPSSPYIQEAKEIQVSVLANTSNYKDALMLFESLPTQSENVKKVYPRILYGRAVELLNDQRVNEANTLLVRLLQVPYNESQLPYAYFWLGEIAYRNGNVDAAIQYDNAYLKNPVVLGEVNPINAHYNLGYALLKKEMYSEALSNFQQVAKTISFNPTPVQLDAYIRSGDCYFMNRNYKPALTIYDKVIDMNAKGADYALYQKAIIAGAYNKNSEKINLLQSLIKQYPNSEFASEANFEIANTYMAAENFNAAIPYLQNILKNNDAAALWPKVYLKLGVCTFNLNQNNQSLQNFTQLVSHYPNSPESDEAIEYIRNIFLENHQPDAFVAFMKENGKPVSYSEEDSLTFRSAQLAYDAANFNAAQKGYANYLAKFPDGKYNIEANYFMAEIYLMNKDPQNAFTYYAAVAAKAPNIYAERSVLQCARIAYFDKKDYTTAETYYEQLKQISTQQENKLEAMRGLLRCQYKLQQWKDAVANAQDILNEKGAAEDDRMMANMIVAKNFQSDSALTNAANAYQQVIKLGKSEYSAEAQYRIAQILYLQNQLPAAEKAAFEVIKKYGSYEYWVTDSYLLLGDIYFKENDLFNAEATYKSVAENATIEALKKEAADKLAMVQAAKNKQPKTN